MGNLLAGMMYLCSSCINTSEMIVLPVISECYCGDGPGVVKLQGTFPMVFGDQVSLSFETILVNLMLSE